MFTESCRTNPYAIFLLLCFDLDLTHAQGCGLHERQVSEGCTDNVR